MLWSADRLHGQLGVLHVGPRSKQIREVEHSRSDVQASARLDQLQPQLSLMRYAAREDGTELIPPLRTGRDRDQLLGRPEHRLARLLARRGRRDGRVAQAQEVGLHLKPLDGAIALQFLARQEVMHFERELTRRRRVGHEGLAGGHQGRGFSLPQRSRRQPSRAPSTRRRAERGGGGGGGARAALPIHVCAEL